MSSVSRAFLRMYWMVVTLVDIWCYPGSQDHWLCILNIQPARNVAVEARIKFQDRHRWRELVEKNSLNVHFEHGVIGGGPNEGAARVRARRVP